MANKNGKIYVGQTHIRLILDCDSDLTDATSVIIKCIKPDGSTDSWTTNITITDATEGIVERTPFAASDLDQAGAWKVWAYATYADFTVAPGEVDHLQVYAEGT